MMDMDMDMSGSSSGVPWLDKPVMLHSSRANTCKMTPEQCVYRNNLWRYWYEADHVYALDTVYFLIATIGLFAIVNFIFKCAPASLKRSAPWRKATAGLRYLAYKGYQLPAVRYWSPSLGVVLLGLAGFVFFCAMTLGPKPYYWPEVQPKSYGNSPPIATRTGWMALALLPFVLALSAKANMISALTGVPHEKLQVFHQWTAYAMFVLGLIHTFPFIVYHIHKGDMVKEWKTSVAYWTGVATLIPQAYLTVMSLPSIRNRFYEFFKATHFVVALLFILFFFFHCDFRLSSWDYFIAAGAVYLASFLTAQIRTYLIHGMHTASLDVLPSGLLRIRIPTVTLSWNTGQHLFVRFLSPTLGLHTLTAHPFTICSIPHDPDQLGKAPEIVFLIKPRGGITGRLAKIADKKPGCSMGVLLDGPYGGLSETRVGLFERVVIVAGGSGGGFSLALLEEAVKSVGTVGRVDVVFATRNPALAEWYMGEVEAKLSTFDASGRTSVAVHITNSQATIAQPSNPPIDIQGITTASDTEAKPDKENINITPSHHSNHSSNSNPAVALHQPHRPNIPSVIADATSGGNGKRVGVFVCGPASMLHDTRNAVAGAQRGVFGGSAEEVFLHTEPFSW